MPAKVTQCPKCHTSFRVTEAQLEIANGAVRCGSCLHIFNAAEHWLDGLNRGPDEQPAQGHSEQQEPPIEDTSDDFELSDELLAISDDNPELEAALDAMEFDEPESMPDALKPFDDEPEPAFNDTIEQRALSKIFDDVDSPNKSSTDALDDWDDLASHDTEDSEAIFKELEDEEELFDFADLEEDEEPRFTDTSLHAAVPEDQQPLEEDDLRIFTDAEVDGDEDNYLDLAQAEQEAENSFDELEEMTEEQRLQEEAWTSQLLAEDAPESERSTAVADTYVDEASVTEAEGNSSPQDEQQADPFEELMEQDDNLLFQDTQSDLPPAPEIDAPLDEPSAGDTSSSSQPTDDDNHFVDEPAPLVAGERIGDDRHNLLANIEPEPVVFSRRVDRSAWARRGWIAASFLALIGLGAQYVYFNFEHLSRDDRFRPYLGQLCPHLGCTLPDRDDLRQIRSSNLIVRSHPRERGALVVDAIVTNQASFTQPFPDLELLFSNLDGDVVAGRRFTAEEYLRGELSGLTLMPSQQPVHISLEIVDPGSDAVNYQLHFLPATQG